MSAMDLSNRTVLITGAGGGLGRACATLLAARGADLVLTDRSAAALAETRALCPAAASIAGDITQAETVTEIAAFARAAFGRPVQGVAAAAGLFGPMKPLIAVTEAEYDMLFDLNIRAVWRLCKAIIPQMQEAGSGSVVLFSSTAGIEASRDVPLYSVTKAAVAMMTRTLALNHGAENIRVNCVCPGGIEGPMIEGSIALVDGEAAQAERRARIIAAHPMGRIGKPQEVAEAVAYLLSDAAGFTTGIALPIDGGRLA